MHIELDKRYIHGPTIKMIDKWFTDFIVVVQLYKNNMTTADRPKKKWQLRRNENICYRVE